jgi:hypothetical protein
VIEQNNVRQSGQQRENRVNNHVVQISFFLFLGVEWNVEKKEIRRFASNPDCVEL